MAKATPEDDITIEELLQQRAKFEDWLAKLDESQKLASESVRERVRKDYEKRLTAVVDELRGHADAVADQLAELRNAQSDLTSKQEASEEALAEAELRHAVGEYTEDEWGTLSAESSEALDEVRRQLAQVNGEIDRLAEVQALIAAPVPAPAKGKRGGRKAAPVYNSESWVPDAKQAAGQRETLTPPAPLDAAEAEAGVGRRKVSAPKFVPRGKGKPGGKPKTLRFPTGGAAE
jgi:DNA repair exonuclease SbcCD ATPase subunit